VVGVSKPHYLAPLFPYMKLHLNGKANRRTAE
jgi:hypothetical protein